MKIKLGKLKRLIAEVMSEETLNFNEFRRRFPRAVSALNKLRDDPNWFEPKARSIPLEYLRFEHELLGNNDAWTIKAPDDETEAILRGEPNIDGDIAWPMSWLVDKETWYDPFNGEYQGGGWIGGDVLGSRPPEGHVDQDDHSWAYEKMGIIPPKGRN